MFVRDKTQPVVWNGTEYRSVLEANVAQELHRLGIRHRYEQLLCRPLSYLPDFKIDDLPDDDMGPVGWIEVKPPDAIYAVRDSCGMSERFDRPKGFNLSRDDLAGVAPELVKPKGLAEITGEPVLVASAINRNQTVALVMYPEFVQVTRTHPLVCWKNVLKRRDQEERRRQWQAQETERLQRIERERAEWANRRRTISDNNLRAFKSADTISAKYDGTCVVCGQRVAAHLIVIANFPTSQRPTNWKACCRRHLEVT